MADGKCDCGRLFPVSEANKPLTITDVDVSTLSTGRPGTLTRLPPNAVVEVRGTFVGQLTVRHENGSGLQGIPRVQNGDTFSTGDGRIFLQAEAGATGTATLIVWAPTLASLIRATSSGLANIANNVKGVVPRGSNSPTRIALATGAAGLHTCAADTIKAIVKAKNVNAAMAYVALTAAEVAVATTRFELGQGDWIEIWKPDNAVLAFGYDGTTGDHLFVWEHEE